MISFKDAKVGDKVWSCMHGCGEITNIDKDNIYELEILFDDSETDLYTFDGCYFIDYKYPELFHSKDEFFMYANSFFIEPALEIPKLNIEPDKIEQKAGSTIYIEDNSFHSSHYHGKIEPIDLISSNRLDFNRASIIKYAFRAGKKSGQEKLDIKKIIDYALLLANQEDIELSKEEIIELINYRYNWIDNRKEK